MTKKETHTIYDVEGLILEKLDKLRDSKDRVEQRKIRAEIIRLEKHHRDCNDKHINGKKYPKRLEGLPDDKPMNKKLLNDLIDSVNTNTQLWKAPEPDNLSGVYTKGIIEEWH